MTVPLDQQINGVTDMLYINAVSGDDGTANITVTFDLERDPDLAAVEVQNRVSQAQSQLPQEVIAQGVTVRKQSPDTLMYFAVYSPDDTYDRLFIVNYAYVYIVDQLKRAKGVGDVRVFGSEFGMRIWLRPDRMASLRITAADVAAAIREQNVQAPAGQIGQPPSAPGQSFQYSLRVRGRLVDVEEFAERSSSARSPTAHSSALRDIARVELGARDYNFYRRARRPPRGRMALSLVPGANALETADTREGELEQIARGFPVGLGLKVIYDTSEFVKASIEEVVHTLRRGADPGADRRVPVPAELARDADPDARRAGLAGRDLCRFRVAGLQHQYAVAVRHGARDRHRRRRRDRRGRGRRAQHADARPFAEGRDAQARWTRCRARWSRSRWCWRRCSSRWPSSRA